MSARLNACTECGGMHAKAGTFCSTACRQAYNNRRLQRGGEFYDLYMAYRFERELGVRLGLWQAINRLASNFRNEDKLLRDGRKSWRNPRLVLEERPYLKAQITQVRAGR
jgi:hypothetical protein